MTPTEISQLLTQIEASKLMTVELSMGDLHLKASKEATPVVTAAPQSEPVVVSPETAPTPAITGQVVKSPLVGVVYLQAAPDKPVYHQVGDQVKAGDVLGLIEAMKMMTEIKAPVAGTLTAIQVDNESVVEYDQPLFTISPTKEAPKS